MESQGARDGGRGGRQGRRGWACRDLKLRTQGSHSPECPPHPLGPRHRGAMNKPVPTPLSKGRSPVPRCTSRTSECNDVLPLGFRGLLGSCHQVPAWAVWGLLSAGPRGEPPLTSSLCLLPGVSAAALSSNPALAWAPLKAEAPRRPLCSPRLPA